MRDPIELTAVMLIDRYGRLLLQLRDDAAPTSPNTWGLPGGRIEPSEAPAGAAARELREETGLAAEGGLQAFGSQHLPDIARVKHYFYGATSAGPEDIVLGEGAAMEFTPTDDVLDGRPYTPGTAEMLARFLGSAEYRSIAAAVADRNGPGAGHHRTRQPQRSDGDR